MIDTTQTLVVVFAVTLAVACLSIPYAVSGVLLTDLFPPALRYSGVALSANLAAFISGLVPLAATGLLAVSDKELLGARAVAGWHSVGHHARRLGRTQVVAQPRRGGGARPMTDRSAGQLVVSQLEEQGVERVYCVPGESYLDVLDALHDSKIQTVVCRQEGGAGFMAVADGRITGGVGVAMVTRGPGASNASIAVHTAWQDASPLVLFVGLVPVTDRGRESFQEIDLGAVFGSTAKRVLTLEVPERATEVVAEAFHIAASGRPGPVVVGLPEDVLVERSGVERRASARRQ